MQEDPEGTSPMLADACERAINWAMAMCLSTPSLAMTAAVRVADLRCEMQHSWVMAWYL